MPDTNAFVLGVQKGSLVDWNRGGYTDQTLFGAGFIFSDYGKNAPNNVFDIKFYNFPQIRARVGTSQESPEFLYEGKIDALIAGEDWIKEWAKRGKPNVKIMDLGFGKVELVAAAKRSAVKAAGDDFFGYALNRANAANPFECDTEMPYTARDFLTGLKAYAELYDDKMPLMIGPDAKPTTNGTENVNTAVVVKHVIGAAEGRLDMGAACIVDCTQKGTALEKADAIEVGKIMESQAGLYASQKTIDDPYKNSIVNFIAWMLGDRKRRESPYGMDERMMVKANVSTDKIDGIVKYITENKFCDRGPTLSDVIGVDGINAIEVDIRMVDWPRFAHGIWELNKKAKEPIVTDILRVPILQRLE